MAESDNTCPQCCCRFILTLGFTALFLWLSLRSSNPKCSIQYFYLPALNKSLNLQQPSNNTLYFRLNLDNPNDDKGIYYDALNLTFSYPSLNRTSNQTQSYYNITLPGFYQGHQKSAKRVNSVEMVGVNWSQVVSENNTQVVFRVDLVTAVRFKILSWKTSRRKLRIGTNVEVNDQGEKVNKKGIRLKSGAVNLKQGCFSVVVIISTAMLYTLFIGS